MLTVLAIFCNKTGLTQEKNPGIAFESGMSLRSTERALATLKAAARIVIEGAGPARTVRVCGLLDEPTNSANGGGVDVADNERAERTETNSANSANSANGGGDELRQMEGANSANGGGVDLYIREYAPSERERAPAHTRGSGFRSTLAEVKTAAAIAGIGPLEAERFFYRYAEEDAHGEVVCLTRVKVSLALAKWRADSGLYGNADEKAMQQRGSPARPSRPFKLRT